METPEEQAITFEAQTKASEEIGHGWTVPWVLQKLGGFEMARKTLKARYQELISQLDKQELSLKEGVHYSMFELEAKQQLKDDTSKAKSIKLLEGTIGYKTVPDKLKVVDHKKAYWFWYMNFSSLDEVYRDDVVKSLDFKATLEYIDALEEYIDDSHERESLEMNHFADCVKEVYSKPFEDYFKKTGEVPDGCELVDGYEKFYAKPATLQLEDKKDG